jgi:formylglycine-generating enzyme required for sulfatase activity
MCIATLMSDQLVSMRRHDVSILVVGLVLMSACGGGDSGPSAAEATATPVPVATSLPTSPPQSLQGRTVDGMTMVFVPGGRFDMGSTDAEIAAAIDLCREHYGICNSWYYERESPLHTVELSGFWLDQTEVANAQFEMCVDAGVCQEPTTCREGEATYGKVDASDHPVVCVSWNDADTYCRWVGGRLPTEAEWEYAFRGEARFIYPWGDSFDGERLNYCDVNCDAFHADNRYDDGFTMAAAVSAHVRDVSWIGVEGMAGNVSEWVADWLGDYEPGPVTNPLGPPSGSEKVVKGGNWFFHPTYCRGAIRASVEEDRRQTWLGFRCAVPLDE